MAASNSQRNRVSNAIDSLITHLVPANASDDGQRGQQRQDVCFDLVRDILDR